MSSPREARTEWTAANREEWDALVRRSQEMDLYEFDPDSCVCGCGAPCSTRCWREE